MIGRSRPARPVWPGFRAAVHSADSWLVSWMDINGLVVVGGGACAVLRAPYFPRYCPLWKLDPRSIIMVKSTQIARLDGQCSVNMHSTCAYYWQA